MKPETLTDAEREEFEERAAILEFDGKMSREGAQIVALQLTLDKREKESKCVKN
jgi:hypothetical protein